MIKPIDHCQLCDHMEIAPGKGPVCSLINEKPRFNGKCYDKKYDKTLRVKLSNAIESYETVKFSKGDVMLNLYTYLTLGVVVMGGAYFLHRFLWESGWLSTLPLIVLVAGFSLLGYALGPFRKYKSQMEITKRRLDKITEILRLYSISYSNDIEIVKRRHETPEKQVRCVNWIIEK
ncbi:hypothetical protein N8368_01250 [Bacteroidia bacterium]|nr:hypothetical protein [Bacteroidia bacterium]MDB4107078.1 hypothetical protein [Bacteroidia bacterium]MDB9882618.1 hypothetical protein [Bacteroidia bacterium]MDC1395114.1 hypothetical protein [Bacteroidia bacterium]